MHEALSKTAPVARDPILHRPGRGRERCALAKAQHEADHEKRGEPAYLKRLCYFSYPVSPFIVNKTG